MKFTIELSTGKKIELTKKEMQEIFDMQGVQIRYYPQPSAPWYPIYSHPGYEYQRYVWSETGASVATGSDNCDNSRCVTTGP